jgi:hypothetical protein
MKRPSVCPLGSGAGGLSTARPATSPWAMPTRKMWLLAFRPAVCRKDRIITHWREHYRRIEPGSRCRVGTRGGPWIVFCETKPIKANDLLESSADMCAGASPENKMSGKSPRPGGSPGQRCHDLAVEPGETTAEIVSNIIVWVYLNEEITKTIPGWETRESCGQSSRCPACSQPLVREGQNRAASGRRWVSGSPLAHHRRRDRAARRSDTKHSAAGVL